MKKYLVIAILSLASVGSFATVECEQALDNYSRLSEDKGMLKQHLLHLSAQISQYEQYLSYLKNNPRVKSYMGYTREHLVEMIRRIDEGRKPQIEILATIEKYLPEVRAIVKKDCWIND